MKNRLIATAAALALTIPTLLTGTAAASPVVTAAKLPSTKAPTTKAVAVGSNPYDIAISQVLGQAFVVNDGSVSVVSLLTHRELAEFNTGGFHGQNAIALMQGNTLGYVTDFNLKTVAVFDTETRKLRQRIPVGVGAVDVVKANTPHGQRAYVALMPSNEVVAISTSTGKVTQRIKLPYGPQTLTTAPGGKSLWVGSSNSGQVWVINTRTGQKTKTINVTAGGPISSIAFAPGGKRAWVAGLGGISIVNVKTGKTVKFLPILKVFPNSDGPNTGPVTFNAKGTKAFVVDSTFPDEPERGTVSVVNTKTYRVGAQIRTGIEPVGMAVDAKRNTAYVANYAEDTVTYFSTPK
ncbi:MAG: YncE family protein [Propionibacteriaceae bacterium]